MHSLSPARLIFLVSLGVTFGPIVSAQESQPSSGTAKLRLVVKEPVATNLHVSVVPTATCRPLSDIWVSGGKKRFYTSRAGMLDSPPIREGVVELDVPAEGPIGIPVNLHVAKLGWSQILFATNPAMADSIRGAQPGVCETPVFLPRSGGQYEVTFAAGPRFCHVAVAELTGSSGQVVRTSVEASAIAVRKTGRKKYACGAPE